MATSAGDAALRPLQRAMKLANQAIQLDTDNMHREAYMEYLRSVSYMSQILLDEAEQIDGSYVLSSDSQKMLKLAEQCLERARSTAGKLGRPGVEVLSGTPRISDVPDPPSCEASSSSPPVTSSSPHSLHSRRLGHVRSCSDGTQISNPFPPPEVFENLRAAEAQSARKELTPLEEASIQNQKLRAAYEARLARLNPNQAAQKTSLTLSLQRQMMENLVIAKAREETLLRKAEERRQRLQDETNSKFLKCIGITPEGKEERKLYISIMEYEHDHEWVKLCKVKIKRYPNDSGLVASVLFQILSTPDHPIAELVRSSQCRIYSQLYPVIKQEPLVEVTQDDLFSKSLPFGEFPVATFSPRRLKSSQSFHSLPSMCKPQIQHSLSIEGGLKKCLITKDSQTDSSLFNSEDKESSFEILESFLSPTASEQTLIHHLNYVVHMIHSFRDKLLSLAFLALDIPSDSNSKEECLECIEDHFFPPLWPPLIAFYRRIYGSREEDMLKTMNFYSNASPSLLGVPRMLYPQNVDKPYRAAVEELGLLPEYQTPQRKLECIARSLRLICQCAEEYSAKPGTSAIGADDLLPLLSFVLLKSRMSYLLSECVALVEFIPEWSLIGEEGYCLTSLQSAFIYLEDNSWRPVL